MEGSVKPLARVLGGLHGHNLVAARIRQEVAYFHKEQSQRSVYFYDVFQRAGQQKCVKHVAAVFTPDPAPISPPPYRDLDANSLRSDPRRGQSKPSVPCRRKSRHLPPTPLSFYRHVRLLMRASMPATNSNAGTTGAVGSPA